MKPRRINLRDERGMTLVFVGMSFVALMSAAMLALDVGMMMVARTQSQNAADAGALAGAVALTYDNFEDRSASGPAVQSAIAAATSTGNQVVNAQASVIPEDVTFPTIDRVRVKVYRTGERGNPLMLFLGPMFGIDTTDVGAEAVAETSPANAMTCVKPFTIPDKWVEKQTPPWDPSDTFDMVDKKGNPIANPDVYIPVGSTDYSGYNAVTDRGTQLTIKAGTGNNLEPSFYFAWRMPGGTGADFYRDNIANCNTAILSYGDLIDPEPGNMVGPTKQGIEDLIAKDPSAYWDTAANKVHSTQKPSARVVAIPLFDPVYYDTGKLNGANASLKVINYMGFFIEGMKGGDVVGRITPIGGIYDGEGGPAPIGAFPKVIILVE
jgi:hypothetical protein